MVFKRLSVNVQILQRQYKLVTVAGVSVSGVSVMARAFETAAIVGAGRVRVATSVVHGAFVDICSHATRSYVERG